MCLQGLLLLLLPRPRRALSDCEVGECLLPRALNLVSGESWACRLVRLWLSGRKPRLFVNNKDM